MSVVAFILKRQCLPANETSLAAKRLAVRGAAVWWKVVETLVESVDSKKGKESTCLCFCSFLLCVWLVVVDFCFYVTGMEIV